jgi:hypothetical protein
MRGASGALRAGGAAALRTVWQNPKSAAKGLIRDWISSGSMRAPTVGFPQHQGNFGGDRPLMRCHGAQGAV